MLPFFVAGAIVLYGVNAGANAMMNCMYFSEKIVASGLMDAADEFRNDPRNPYAKESAKPQQKGDQQGMH